jgi:hypothetical protein
MGIGDNMALGLGEGFEESMKEVNRDIQKSVPTDFDISSTINSVNSLQNVGISGISGGYGGSENLNIVSVIITRLDIMTEILSNILSTNSHEIYLDNGVLVGELTPQIDTSLGDLQVMKGR